jgi:hypothetical protein
MITGMTAQTYRPFLDVLVAHTDLRLPEGCDTLGWKTVRPDLRSHGGFRWPWPGDVVSDPHAAPGGSTCPSGDTGGFSIAKNWHGARAGGHGGSTILLLAYARGDVLAEDACALRVQAAHVIDVIDVCSLIRDECAGAYLAGADLAGANLTGADLPGAYLAGADLTRTSLRHANLTDAYLPAVNLTSADLTDADLTGANLAYAENLETVTGYNPAGNRTEDPQPATR